MKVVRVAEELVLDGEEVDVALYWIAAMMESLLGDGSATIPVLLLLPVSFVQCRTPIHPTLLEDSSQHLRQ